MATPWAWMLLLSGVSCSRAEPVCIERPITSVFGGEALNALLAAVSTEPLNRCDDLERWLSGAIEALGELFPSVAHSCRLSLGEIADALATINIFYEPPTLYGRDWTIADTCGRTCGEVGVWSNPACEPDDSIAPVPVAWSNTDVEGGCVIHRHCICSNNFHGGECDDTDYVDVNYSPGDGCVVEFSRPVVLTTHMFIVQPSPDCSDDRLVIDGVRYCGRHPPPDGTVATSFEWRSDGGLFLPGFKICVRPGGGK